MQEDVEIYRELQYDEMFGHQYVAKYLSELMAARALLPRGLTGNFQAADSRLPAGAGPSFLSMVQM